MGNGAMTLVPLTNPGQCLDIPGGLPEAGKALALWFCNGKRWSQGWFLKDGRLMDDTGLCVLATPVKDAQKTTPTKAAKPFKVKEVEVYKAS